MTSRSMINEMERTIADLDLTEADSAMIELARRYATEIDADPDALEKIGPKLRLTIESLLARGIPKGGVQGDADDGDFLAEVRQIHPGQHHA